LIKEKISSSQALAFVIAGGIGIIFFWISEASVPVAGRDSWIAYILGYGLSIPIAFSMIKINERFPTKTFIEYVPLIIGRIGKPFTLIYIVTYLYFTALILNLSINLLSLFFIQTPSVVLAIIASLLIVIVAKYGIETFARVCEMFIPIILITIFLLIILTVPEINIKLLEPMLEKGVLPIFKLAPQALSFAGQYIVFMAIWLPLLNKPKLALRAVLIGAPISAITLIIVLNTIIAVFSAEVAETMAFSMVKLSQVARFPGLEGIPSIVLGVWIIASFVNGSVFFFPVVIGMSQWFKIKDYRTIVLPVGLLVTALSLLPDSYFAQLQENKLLGLYVSLPIILSIPLLWVIAWVRNVRE